MTILNSRLLYKSTVILLKNIKFFTSQVQSFANLENVKTLVTKAKTNSVKQVRLLTDTWKVNLYSLLKIEVRFY